MPTPAAGKGHSTAVTKIAVVAVALVLLAELAVRALSPRLPEPLTWYHPSAQVKVEQMDGLARAGATVDIVFAGTSQMAFAVDPLRFTEQSRTHPSTYNAAVLAGYPAVNHRFLPEEVVPRLHPTTVVYGLSAADVQRGDEAPYDESTATARSFFGDLDRWASGRSALVRHRQDLRGIDIWTLALLGGGGGSVEHYRTEAIGPSGNWNVPDTHVCKTGPDVRPVGPATFTPDETRVSTVWSTVDDLTARGIKVVIAVMPVGDCFRDVFNAGDAERAGRDFIAEGARRRGLELFDASQEIHTNDLFANPGHVNQAGAQRYTELLARRLDGA